MRLPHRSKSPISPQETLASWQQAQPFWQAPARWFRVNTFAPAWLGKRWAHPLTGIMVALLSQLVVFSLRQLLVQVLPQAGFYTSLSLLCVAIIALSWGAGPSSISTLLGAVLLDIFILPQQFSLPFDNSSVLVSVLMYLLAGFTISALASQTERARRNAQTLAGSLEQERARLETIMETIPDAVSLYDAQGHMLWLNRKGRQMVGAAPILQPAEEMPAFYAIRTPSGTPLPLEQLPLIRAMKGETIEGMELRYRSPQGREHLISGSAAPLFDAQGRVDNVVIITHDISALRQAESEAARQADELEATTTLLEGVIEAITDGVYVYDAQGYLLQINNAARGILKRYNPTGDLSLPVQERSAQLTTYDEQGQALPPEEYPSVRVLRGEVLNGANSVDMVLRAADGGNLQLNVNGAPIRDASGQQIGAVVVARDVTERRRLEQRTQEALEALLLMAEALTQIPPVSPSGEAKTRPASNEVAQRLVELTRRVLGCQRVSIAAVEAETALQRPMAVVALSAEEEAFWWNEQPKIRLDAGPDPTLASRLRAGEIVIINAPEPPYQGLPNLYNAQSRLAVPIRIGERLIGVLELDYGTAPPTFSKEELALAGAVSQLSALVLERERLLRERAEAQARVLALQETNERMDDFLSIVSHELRTPVTSIKTGIQLMRKRIAGSTNGEPGTPERLLGLLQQQQSSLQRTDQQIRRLTHLLDDLIDLSRIRMGRIEIRAERCDLNALVVEVVEDEQMAYPERVISVELPPGLPIQVMADPNRVGQVLTNYLTNALKYSLVERPVQVGLHVEGQRARVWARDQGPGIPPEEQEHIWELFHRVPGIEVKSGSGIGLGLGLHISKAMIERHQGEVGVESTQGQGSTFWFTLPLADTPKDESAPGTA